MSSTGALEASKLKNVLRLTLQLTEAVVFSGVLKLSPIETKLRMESGGAIRQGMRLGKFHNPFHNVILWIQTEVPSLKFLVLASASLSTIQSNMEFKVSRQHCYVTLCGSLGTLLCDIVHCVAVLGTLLCDIVWQSWDIVM